MTNIIRRDIEDEMKESYIDYSMSVIVSRALPDVRDGLKPVHRRILYSMNELNLAPNTAYKKSARRVGDTIGKYHPHGDTAIYDAMARMAQDFTMRCPLVDGHGNFGSPDGDAPAAARYTEARLSHFAVLMLDDIEKGTVDFTPNYDGELTEPVVLPAKFPNLLVNGSAGIAVGMATNIPPHNLTEIISGVVKIIDNRLNGSDTDIHELLHIIKGPDFPTGAQILGTAGIKEAYLTGRGKVMVRATAEIEPASGGRDMIVVTDIPYMVNKARMLERIGELIKDKKIEGISDMRDESNREGIRVVIELKKDQNASVVLNRLYKNSQLQDSVGIIMLALVGGQPRVLNLKDVLCHYIDHQKDVILRRTRFDLVKCEKRAHILEGLIIALNAIDDVIALIRAQRDRGAARAALCERFGLSDEQSGAIVAMQLGSLTGLEREKIDAELAELKAAMERLRLILSDEPELYRVIRAEALEIKEKFHAERRTQIVPDPGEIDVEDLLTDDTYVITLTALNYIKRQSVSVYRLQRRGGKGVMGLSYRENDAIRDLFIADTRCPILFFTNLGRVFTLKAYEIPEASRAAMGTNIINLLNLNAGEKVAAVIPMPDFSAFDHLLMLTKQGIAKKTRVSEYENIRKSGLRALVIAEGDELLSVLSLREGADVFVATRRGFGIRFNEGRLRPLSRVARGVRAIRLKESDCAVGAAILEEGAQIFLVSENGYGKRTEYDAFRAQNRAGKGLKIYKVTEKTGPLAGMAVLNERDELMILNSNGVIIRINAAAINSFSRAAMGVKLINLNEGEYVAGITPIREVQRGAGADNLENAESETENPKE